MPIHRRRKAGLFSLLIMGIILTAVGGCLSWFVGADNSMSCQRSADQCVLEKTNLLGRREVVKSFPLSQLKSAEVTEKRSTRKRGRKGGYTYNISLITANGRVPFSNVSSSDREEHQKNADAINAFLSSGQETLVVVQSGKTARLLGYALFGIGVLVLLRGAWKLFKALVTVGVVLGAKG